MQIHSVGIDMRQDHLLPGSIGAAGTVLVRKKFSLQHLLAYTANMPTSLIGLEACSGAHFLGRALRKQGHDARLIIAQFVKPFVKSNKSDYVDAEAIAEAVGRRTCAPTAHNKKSKSPNRMNTRSTSTECGAPATTR